MTKGRFGLFGLGALECLAIVAAYVCFGVGVYFVVTTPAVEPCTVACSSEGFEGETEGRPTGDAEFETPAGHTRKLAASMRRADVGAASQ